MVSVFGQKFIRQVEFNHCAISVECLDRVLRLPHLQSLSLHECSLSDRHLRSLGEAEGLVYLSLQDNPITDSALRDLPRLVRLQKVELTSTQVGDETLQALSTLPQLVGVSVSLTNVSGEHVDRWESRESLVRFSAEKTRVGDKFLAFLAGCPNLEVLQVPSCKNVTDRGIEPFRDHPSLRSVDLTSIPLTDASLRSLIGVPKLKRLDLSDRRTTVEARQEFRKKRPEVYFR